MANEIHIGDVGLAFEAEILEGGLPVDLSAATVRQLIFTKSDGTVVVTTAALVTDGTDGKIEYVTTLSTFLSVGGHWRWQPYLELSGWAGHADMQSFVVYGNLN